MDSSINLKNLKGTSDFLPREQIQRNKIISILRTNFEKYGYLPVETPILNYLSLLAYKYDDDAEIIKEIYKLSDQANRKLGLRYDLTIPFCKLISLNKDLSIPFRRYEIGKVFRNGPVKLGRTREFYQCDVDVVGIDGRYIEVEQLLMVINIFKDLSINIVIKWNNRKLMVGLLQDIGIENELIDKVIGLIDRLDKITANELKQEFNNININEDKVKQLLEIFNMSLDEYYDNYMNTTNVLIKEAINECLEINNYIKAFGIEDKVIFNPKLARGLGIYTGIVFEFFDKDMRIASSLGGGGRYNKIITEFLDDGKEYPSIGLSFGLEPIYTILNMNNENISSIDVLLVPMGTFEYCLKLAEELRNNNINVLTQLNKRKLGKSFEYADRENIKFVVVVGSDEVEKQIYSIKNMQTKEQFNLSIKDAITLIKNNK
ncbi:MAG: histidine--tRNA ligase [bacterium]|nr:histidine--tRNA ligase [bacterium]